MRESEQYAHILTSSWHFAQYKASSDREQTLLPDQNKFDQSDSWACCNHCVVVADNP